MEVVEWFQLFENGKEVNIFKLDDEEITKKQFVSMLNSGELEEINKQHFHREHNQGHGSVTYYQREIKGDEEKMGKEIISINSKEEWNGKNIKYMSNSHLINTMIYLYTTSDVILKNVIIDSLDYINEKDNNAYGLSHVLGNERNHIELLLEIKNTKAWIVETNIYKAMFDELSLRNLREYYNSIMERFILEVDDDNA